MTAQNSATPSGPIAVRPTGHHRGARIGTNAGGAAGSATGEATAGRAGAARTGTLLALLGVVAFSLTFPATAWGLESFGPWSLVALRSVLAALIAGVFLLAGRVPLPARAHWAGLAVVAGGVVAGFPMLTTLALQTSTTSHAAVVVGLLPLTTASLSALRTGARPSPASGRRPSPGPRSSSASRSPRAGEPSPPGTPTCSGRSWCAPPDTPRAGGWPG